MNINASSKKQNLAKMTSNDLKRINTAEHSKKKKNRSQTYVFLENAQVQDFVISPLMAEAMAVRSTLQIAETLDLSLSLSFGSVSFVFTPHSQNEEVDELAKTAFMLSSFVTKPQTVWTQTWPLFYFNFIESGLIRKKDERLYSIQQNVQSRKKRGSGMKMFGELWRKKGQKM